jgi:hypothetical protein
VSLLLPAGSPDDSMNKELRALPRINESCGRARAFKIRLSALMDISEDHDSHAADQRSVKTTRSRGSASPRSVWPFQFCRKNARTLIGLRSLGLRSIVKAARTPASLPSSANILISDRAPVERVAVVAMTAPQRRC